MNIFGGLFGGFAEQIPNLHLIGSVSLIAFLCTLITVPCLLQCTQKSIQDATNRAFLLRKKEEMEDVTVEESPKSLTESLVALITVKPWESAV